MLLVSEISRLPSNKHLTQFNPTEAENIEGHQQLPSIKEERGSDPQFESQAQDQVEVEIATKPQVQHQNNSQKAQTYLTKNKELLQPVLRSKSGKRKEESANVQNHEEEKAAEKEVEQVSKRSNELIDSTGSSQAKKPRKAVKDKSSDKNLSTSTPAPQQPSQKTSQGGQTTTGQLKKTNPSSSGSGQPEMPLKSNVGSHVVQTPSSQNDALHSGSKFTKKSVVAVTNATAQSHQPLKDTKSTSQAFSSPTGHNPASKKTTSKATTSSKQVSKESTPVKSTRSAKTGKTDSSMDKPTKLEKSSEKVSHVKKPTTSVPHPTHKPAETAPKIAEKSKKPLTPLPAPDKEKKQASPQSPPESVSTIFATSVSSSATRGYLDHSKKQQEMIMKKKDHIAPHDKQEHLMDTPPSQKKTEKFRVKKSELEAARDEIAKQRSEFLRSLNDSFHQSLNF